jgi:ribosomal protein S27E
MDYNLTKEQIDKIIDECSKHVEIRCIDCIHNKVCSDAYNFRTGCIFNDKEIYLNRFSK